MHLLEHNYSCCHITHILNAGLGTGRFFVEWRGFGVCILGNSILMNSIKLTTLCIMVHCVKVQEGTGTIISIYQTADFLLFAYLKTSQPNRICHINTFILKLLLYIHVCIYMYMCMYTFTWMITFASHLRL